MASRRADAGPGLIDRVRWGNVGRLAALLAACLLLATGPHGCGGAPGNRPQATALAPQPVALPPAVNAPPVRPSSPAARRKQQSRKPRRKHHTRPRQHHRTPAKHLQSAIPQSVVSPAPVAPAAPPPAPVEGGE